MSDFQAIADRVEIEALRGEFTDTSRSARCRHQNLVKCSKHSWAASMSANAATSDRFTAR